MVIRINKTKLYADVIMYVDAINGSDDNNGSKNSPYKTLEKAFEKVNDFAEDVIIGVLLGDGQYNNGEFTRKTKNTSKIMIIGNTRSELITTPIFANTSSDPCKCIIEYYRLIWSDDLNTHANKVGFLKDVNIYNVIFNNITDNAYSYFWGVNMTLTIQNCVKNTVSSAFIRTDSSTTKVIDSIGEFTSGYGTLQTSWDYAGNIIKEVQFDSEHIPVDTEFKHLGSGKNPDGKAAHVGVYGGEFAWGEWGVRCFIHQDDTYYTIKNDQLVEVTDISADSIYKDGCFMDAINSNINLLKDTFKLVFREDVELKIDGLKSSKEMVVASSDFRTSIQEHIDYFKCEIQKSGNTQLKVIFSIDGGVSWKSHNGANFIDLNIEIPLKKFEELSSEELKKWNQAKKEILENGIDIASLEHIDFNTLEFDKIRFAYGIGIETIDDFAINKNLIWQFDNKGSMKQMKDIEFDLTILSNGVEFKSLIDTDMIKINIMT